MSRLMLFFFGPPCIVLNGERLVTLNAKTQALLAYLAIEADRPYRRESLAGLLWPEQPEEAARNSLRQAIFQLHRAIGEPSPPFLLATPQTVQFNNASDYSLDVAQFTSLIAECEKHLHRSRETCRACKERLQSAAELYRGDLLADLFLKDSPPFEEWILVRREYFARMALSVLDRLAAYYARRGEYDRMAQMARRQIGIDSFREEAHCQVMRALAWRGQRSAALAQYNVCRQLLKEEFGIEPSCETTALYEHIRDGKLAEEKTPVSTNVPIPLTSFVGRQREIAEVQELLEATRLLTLTGAGGCGKTRLAIQVARNLVEEFPDGVWFVELAPLSDPALVPQSVASVFGVREQAGYALVDLLIDYLRAKQLVLVLDNCEHLIEACAQLADRILHAAPQVQLLATSRGTLGIAGEQVYRVPSLQLPDPIAPISAEALAQIESVQLFVVRARAVQPKCELTEANASTVAQICRRLDGIPLAIELAAARVPTLSVEQISQRLDDRFHLLTGGSRTELPRHQTLRAMIDWSYDLLTVQERLLLRRLAVFAGGWTLEAAEDICSGADFPKSDILERLMHLVDKSLVILNEQGSRYRMLETIRKYARDKLFESGESERLRHRHLDYYMRWAEAVEPKLKGAEQLTYLKQLETDADNLRAALEWSVENDVEAGLRLAGALVWFWWLHVHWSEGWNWLQQLLARSNQSSSIARAKALFGAAHLLAFSNAGTPAEGWAEQALSLAKSIGDKKCLACSLFSLGLATSSQKDYSRSLRLYEDSLVLFRELGDEWWTATTLFYVGGRLAWGFDDYVRAQVALEQSLEIFRRLGDRWGQSLALANLGFVARVQGRLEHAQACYEEMKCLVEELDDKLGIARALLYLGTVAFVRRDYPQAAALYEASLKVKRDHDIKTNYSADLLRLALVKLHCDDLVRARSLIIEAYRNASDQTVRIACLDEFAIIWGARKQPERAVRLFGAAQALLESTGVRPWRVIGSQVERNVAAARKQLGQAAFDAAWNEGRAMTIEQAIAYALEDSRRE